MRNLLATLFDYFAIWSNNHLTISNWISETTKKASQSENILVSKTKMLPIVIKIIQHIENEYNTYTKFDLILFHGLSPKC